ncbi:endoglucanase Acf2 [Allocatelliglobosispora scoriae]|uniref:glucan endo-1,3-beta-D-glucosidase n=1 Tax=Allocatelliglobosispora scoriae TaxID=643052 RepID=A0A841BS34_9ACTN|nr:glycosyl hydrolase [Allocatelliglobosispora scoriae]MBB5869610.1 endoglucanase Acf2 [Allocatelliglobosispora scoriae]
MELSIRDTSPGGENPRSHRAGPLRSGLLRTRRHRSGLRALAVSTAVGLAVGLAGFVASQPAEAGTVGAGSYADTLPPGAASPVGCGSVGSNPRAYVTANAPAGAIPTNDWWSSLLWKKFDCTFSEPLHAHPVSYDTFNNGIGLSYNTTAAISGSATGPGEYHYPYTENIRVGVAGLNAPDVRVDGWTDWTVTPYWSDGTRTMKATIGHGLPFSYYQITGGNAQITVNGTPTVWSNSGTTIGFSIAGKDYVAYAPTGATWTVSGTVISSTLAGKGFFSVAVLPVGSDRTALAATYGQVAHAHVTGTRVSYAYNQAAATLNTTYTYTTTAREGSASGTVVALYPHQWNSLSGSTPIANTYVSARGTMKVLTGTSAFTTSMKYQGVLPEIPAVADSSGADLTTITNYLNAELANPADFRGDDTYWNGKGLGRAARVAEIADQLNLTSIRTAALNVIRTRLTDWFTASPGEAAHVFYYNPAWGTLIGYPASYGSDQELNDHHFHYGYFIAAAATLAKFDPAWATTGQYGGMVDMLIRDANNYDRSDTRFPYLRDFDIFAGHDWAAGHGAFASGNNQESSSEGMNFANALIQWGQATGNAAVRDAGIFIYTTQSAAIQEYWFDSRNQNFPSTFAHNTVGMVWGDGGAYATWFSGEPEMIQGINMLPVTGGHFYMGENPGYVTTNYNELVTNNGGPPTVWQDIIWEFQALGNGDTALANFRANPGFTSEEGESKAHTFHWIRNLAALGNVDTTITANHPLAKVFLKGSARTYVASNITNAAITVTFSNGTTLAVPAGKTVTSGAFTWSGGNANGGGNPSPQPSTSTQPSPSPSASCGGGGAVLLSQGKPATASSVEGAYTADLAFDASTTTRWGSAFSDPQWIQVDLGSVQNIASVALLWEAAYGKSYQIQTSTNGTTWTTVYSTTTGDGGTDNVTATGSGRYVRLNGTVRGTAYGYSLFDFKVWGGCSTPPTSPSPSPSTPPTSFTAVRYPQAGGTLPGTQGTAASATISAAAGEWNGTPHNPLTYTATGLTATYSGGATTFDLFVDAGTNVGNATQVRVSYDLTGNGSFDRVETFSYFPTDPVAGWEHYTQASGSFSATGALGNLAGGIVKVEVWNAIGSTTTNLGIGNQTKITLPFS